MARRSGEYREGVKSPAPLTERREIFAKPLPLLLSRSLYNGIGPDAKPVASTISLSLSPLSMVYRDAMDEARCLRKWMPSNDDAGIWNASTHAPYDRTVAFPARCYYRPRLSSTLEFLIPSAVVRVHRDTLLEQIRGFQSGWKPRPRDVTRVYR